MTTLRCKLPIAMLLFATLTPHAGEAPADHDARMAWWREARFGMFIHWGLYAVPGGEWNGKVYPDAGEWILHHAKIPVHEYEPLTNRFNPVKFDARQWARLAKAAGMRYIVITSKHHDGFGLWDSKLTDWDVMATPFQRDILRELSRACRAEGIKFCTYHSIMDWHHPDYLPRRAWDKRPTGDANLERYVDYLKGQLKELVTGYRPAIMWFDGEWENTWTHERGADLFHYCRALDPKMIINNRVDKGRKGMAGLTREGEFFGDYGTPEQEIPVTGLAGIDWESCMTMNKSWGFHAHDQNWKSAETLIRNLIDCASKGGNYLLNVGPTAEGLIPEPSVERLAAIGRWMKVNGESIYGTTASPFAKTPWGRATKKPGKVYLHVFDWPGNGELEVPLKNKVTRARLLGGRSAKLEVESSESGLRIKLPAAAPDAAASVIALDIKGDPQVQRP